MVMYGCENWIIKKAEHQRIDAFELRCWRRLLRVPWTARRSNQSILKEISPGYSLERLMLKLKLQYFGHLMWRADSLKRPWSWERLRAGGEGDNRRWDGWMASLTQWTWVWASSRSWWWTGQAWHAAVHGVAKSRTWLSDWTELMEQQGSSDFCCGSAEVCVLLCEAQLKSPGLLLIASDSLERCLS